MENKEVVNKSELLELASSAKNQINSLPYVAASKSCNAGHVNTPTKLYYETMKSLQRLKELGIETTEYVKTKLKYNSTLAVCKAFSAEQVDGIALAIYQVEVNKETFIIGDGTGMGKGRECAGLLRYAYHAGKIPMFLSKDTSLFNSIYRDIIDIGGFDENGKLPNPLIFNGCGSSSFNEELKKEVFENDIIVDGEILFRSIKKEEVMNVVRSKKMPNKYDMILSTYSVFSGDLEGVETGRAKNTKAILDFLEKNQDSMFMLLDEAHQGAGNGSLNRNLKLIQQTNAIFVFSSATFAKRYENLKFYIDKTAIKSSGVSEKNIELFVEEFKDNALEFISQGLAESGQFIRRELTLEGCEVDYKYEVGKKDQQWNQYDLLMGLLREITDFYRSPEYKKSVTLEIEKLASENKLELATSPMPKSSEELESWLSKNSGKYVYSQYLGATVKNRNTWIENLLFALKADFVADRAISLLKNKVDYSNTLPTGAVVNVSTNMKPLVTVRNTGETNISLLDKNFGDIVSDSEMDFSYTLTKVLQQCIKGDIKFEKVNPNEERKDWKKVVLPLDIDVENLPENGKTYKSLMERILSSVSGLPLSPLDYIIDKVNSTDREGWDYKYTKSNKYIIEDTSKRSSMLKKTDGVWYYVPTKSESNSLKIARFNNGRADVVIINVSASTGESFQSSFKFEDTRKRCMILHQVELDVVVEMQKLGRVNRTGQINFPRYEYAISLVPSEVRRLMSLRKKLRSLSAASTGNMNQAASYTEIKDKEGNPLEDIFTKYGYDVLMVYLEQDPEILGYTKEQAEWIKKIIPAEEKLNDFCRQIEIAPCEIQNNFYEKVNTLYREKRISMMAADEWDLDSDIINYKASVKNRAVLYQDSGETIFRSPVYLQDCYATPQSKPYTKQEVLEKMDFYAKGKKHKDFYEELCANLEAYLKKYREEHLEKAHYISLINENGKPLEGEELKSAEQENESKKQEVEKRVNDFLGWVYRLIAGGQFKEIGWGGLTIGKPCVVPENERIILEAHQDYNNEKITAAQYEERVNRAGQIYARFIGYKVDESQGVINPSNITLIFAMLNGERAEYRIKPTKNNKCILEDFILSKSARLHSIQLKDIDEWKVSTKPRIIIKTVTGNLLRAFDITEKIIGSEDKIKIGSYTTIDGEIQKGLIITRPYKFGQSGESFEMKEYTPQYTPCNSVEITGSYSTYHLSDGLSRIEGKDLKIYFKDLNPKSSSTLNSVHASLIPQLQELADKLGVKYWFDHNVLAYTYKNGIQSRNRSNVNRFTINYNQLIADYFYEQTKEVVEKGVKPLEYGREDEFKVLVEEEKAQSAEKGIYEYAPSSPFNENKKPPYFLSFSPSTIYPYGVITTEYPLDELTMTSYQCVPINVNNEVAYKKMLARMKQLGKLESMISYVINNKENYVGITLEAQKNTYYPMKYYFGDMNMANIGRIISSFITKEEVPINVEEEEKYQKAKFLKTEIPLSMETAQDFLIKFNV